MLDRTLLGGLQLHVATAVLDYLLCCYSAPGAYKSLQALSSAAEGVWQLPLP